MDLTVEFVSFGSSIKDFTLTIIRMEYVSRENLSTKGRQIVSR
jgi:hypothetical protein